MTVTGLRRGMLAWERRGLDLGVRADSFSGLIGVGFGMGIAFAVASEVFISSVVMMKMVLRKSPSRCAPERNVGCGNFLQCRFSQTFLLT